MLSRPSCIGALILSGVFGCGRIPSAPTAPMTQVQLSAPAEFVLVGESVGITAVNMTTREPVAIELQNLTPAIATLKGNLLTGIENGIAVLSAGVSTSSSRLTLRVISNYNGWYPGRKLNGDADIGSAYAVECIEFRPGYCISNVLEERLGKGPEPFAMHLVQVREQVSGDVYVRCGNASVTGTISESGQLSLRGAFGLKGPPTCPIEEWATTLVDSGRSLVGRFKYSTNIGGFGGLVTMELRGVPRVN